MTTQPAISLSPDLFDRVNDMATSCNVSIPDVIERLMTFSGILTKLEMRRMEGLPAMGDYEMVELMQDAEVQLESKLRERAVSA